MKPLCIKAVTYVYVYLHDRERVNVRTKRSIYVEDLCRQHVSVLHIVIY